MNSLLLAARVPPVQKRISEKLAYGIAWLCERVFKGLRIYKDPPLTRFLVLQMAHAHWFDISAARRDLAYEPRVSIAEGMKRFGESMR